MKCKFCGARAKKSDELCSECGHYLNKKAVVNALKSKNESDGESDFGRKLKFFDCQSQGSTIMTEICVTGAFLIAFTAYMIYKNYEFVAHAYLEKLILQGAFFISLWILLILAGVSIYLTFKKCFIYVGENGVYGIRPRLFRRCEWFEFYYSDITDFRCRIPAENGIAYVKVVADGKTYTFCCLDNTDTSLLSSYIRENMPKRKHKRK